MKLMNRANINLKFTQNNNLIMLHFQDLFKSQKYFGSTKCIKKLVLL